MSVDRNILKSFYIAVLQVFSLVKSAGKTALLLVLALALHACDSEDPDFLEENFREETPPTTQGGALSVTSIFIDQGFSELHEALTYVDDELYTALVERFATGTKQHTVFVPNNEAFYELYTCLGMQSKDISELGDPGLVRDILQLHVIEERLTLDQIIQESSIVEVPTFYGTSINVNANGLIESDGNSALININESDKLASNGVVHVISTVLLPNQISCVANE